RVSEVRRRTAHRASDAFPDAFPGTAHRASDAFPRTAHGASDAFPGTADRAPEPLTGVLERAGDAGARGPERVRPALGHGFDRALDRAQGVLQHLGVPIHGLQD